MILNRFGIVGSRNRLSPTLDAKKSSRSVQFPTPKGVFERNHKSFEFYDVETYTLRKLKVSLGFPRGHALNFTGTLMRS